MSGIEREGSPSPQPGGPSSGSGSGSGSGGDTKFKDEAPVPRQQWQALVLQRYHDVLELRERLRGVSGQPSYGRLMNAARTEVKETLSHQNMLQLLYLFLQEEGMNDTLKSLQQESKVAFCNSDGLPVGAMTGLLRLSIKDAKNLFNESEQDSGDQDPEVVVSDYVPAGVSFDKDTEEDEDKGLDTESGLDGLIFDSKKEVVSGTLNSLIAWLTSPANTDILFRKTFVLTYHAFTTPPVLLNKLIRRYYAVDRLTTLSDESKKLIHSRIFMVLRIWIERHRTDWNDEKLQSQLLGFLGKASDVVRLERATVRNALDNRDKKHQILDQTNAPDPKVPKNISVFSPNLTLDDIDEEEIARQLTLIEYEYYEVINSSELLRRLPPDVETPEWGPNVTAALERSNKVARWVATSILTVPELKLRARVLARFIRIADHLRRPPQNNFGTFAAVFAGINNSSVCRLRFTRRELPKEEKKTLEELERLMSPENSYSNYRTAYENAWPPLIPFLGVHLRDLAMVEESVDDDEGGKGEVDFVRCRCSFPFISFLLHRFKPIPYNFHHVHQIASFLRTFSVKEISDEEMDRLSNTIEPKNSEFVL